MITLFRKFLCFVAVAGAFALGSAEAQQLPSKLAGDPVTKALGAKVVAAALKEGVVEWYGGSTTRRFLKAGRKKAFEKRFGIKIKATTGRLRNVVDRVRTEHAVGKLVADAVAINDQYMHELHKLGMFVKWRPPGKELARINPKVFPTDPVGYWWPLGISAQGLVVNTNMVAKKDYPKSYLDLLDPKWKGKIVTRDPRSAGGGAWQMLHVYNHPDLGIKYIKNLKANAKPFIQQGGVSRLRDSVLLGRFAIGFNGRGEFLRDLPKGSPIDFIIPKEGLAWTPISFALLKGARHPNAVKVLMAWFYSDLKNLQVWTDRARPIPHPGLKTKIKKMSVTAYPLMDPIPPKQLASPNFFFKQMEKVFGIR
jgi:iron(III) transport system substrate-binding protein